MVKKKTEKKETKKAETVKEKPKAKVAVKEKIKAAAPKTKTKKTDAKKDVKAVLPKADAHPTDATVVKDSKEAKPKKVKKSRKVQIKTDAAVAKTRRKVNQKQGTPTFRGRFGKRSLRKKSNPKWNKWRFPRGIDVKHEMCDGYTPKEGFRTPKEIRDIHPSGYREFNVKTIQEINNVPDKHAIRVASGLGRKKKLAIVDKAIEKGIKVLNP
ncbi:MAG: eL32 family ribosomal protein [Candidatus Diapherotrites archaeon]